ncbi:MAG: cytochrome c peroxidase [Bacteroidota bacterium]
MKTKIYILFFIVLSLIIFVIACHKDEPIPTPDDNNGPTPYNITIPKYFPTMLNIPADNPMTVEGIELGRYLFYDGRLCGKQDTLMSCGTCHMQQYGFENGLGYAQGVTGIQTPHVMLPMINLVFNSSGYLWNGKLYNGNPAYTTATTYGGILEDVAWMAVYAPWECHSDTNASKQMIQSIQMYPPMFKAAFGSETVTFKNISKAIAQFVRTLISGNSKFDRYLKGQENLTAQEFKGYVIFNTEKGDCFHCHGTILFTTNGFFNNAKDSVFTADTRDRFHVTGDPADIGAYKATTLRNISVTGPYMHDGRFATLDEVINFYSEGLVWSPYVSPFMKKVNDGGVQLLPSEKADLKAFLLTLTDTEFLTNPDFAKPAGLP